MKTRLLALACLLLSVTAFASNTVKYDFTGIIDQVTNWQDVSVGDAMHGSFVLNYDADVPVDITSIGAGYDALTNITYDVGGKTYEDATVWTWHVVDATPSDVLSFQDAVMTGGSDVNGYFSAAVGDAFTGSQLDNSKTLTDYQRSNWALTAKEFINEKTYDLFVGGHVTSIEADNRYADAIPAPEPSSLALLGSGLLVGLGLFRKPKRNGN